MSYQALQKRTFGFENEEWLEYFIVLSFIVLVGQGLSFLIEWFLVFLKLIPYFTSKNAFVTYVTFGHFLGFFLSQFVMGIFLIVNHAEWKSHKSAFRKMVSFTVFTVIYLYNPWIVAYQVEAVGFYNDFKCTALVFTLSAPIILVAWSFYTFFMWRMSRIEADYEPCEVIYGAEDSETKKLMEYYE
ncbi:hypothetical protein GCK72_008695 [Caenorhabditis remanei]|uniref:Uncharacterized protein n=1 Tax=Caenorhabditis remanei TaxID=31234 RepID=A0A6A5H0Y6_CAERE|nr:hypothetical protein GCK72_008695 [Caenorhabditis remanei]KAF1760446.1 hypothetical protein GCK72_008695 [Caenorhabditis remanei]